MKCYLVLSILTEWHLVSSHYLHLSNHIFIIMQKHRMYYYSLMRLCLYICIATVTSVMSFSCNSDNLYPKESQNDIDSKSIRHEKTLSLTSPDVIELTQFDAIAIAQSFSSLTIDTKSPLSIAIDNVFTIKDNNHNDAIHVVNYSEGCLLVSATKKYYPILAYLPKGHYNINESNPILNLIINDYLDKIAIAKTIESDKTIVDSWKLFEQSPPIIQIATKTDYEYDSMMQYWISLWNQEGVTWHYLNNPPNDMPSDLYDSFCGWAAEYDREDYDYMQYSVITEKTYPVSEIVGPLIQTHWHQKYPFNSELSDTTRPLGCNTIATGQLMKYYEYPSNIPWGSMPNNTSNYHLSNFLKELKESLLVNNQGSTFYYLAYIYLQTHGYSASLDSHSSTSVFSSLTKKQPVFMSGHENSIWDGHSWLCDGYLNNNVYTEYKLYAMAIDGSMNMEQIDNQTIHNQGYVLFHMNWGWKNYTENEGYFLDDIGSSAVLFPNNRHDIIITSPKKYPELW